MAGMISPRLDCIEALSRSRVFTGEERFRRVNGSADATAVYKRSCKINDATDVL